MTIRQEKRTFNTYEEAISLGLKDKTKRACGDTMNDSKVEVQEVEADI